MYSFRNDYSEGAHPQVLQALTDTNLVQTCGYGVDPICEEARDLIRTVCAAPEADVHFLVGGTQTNLTVITEDGGFFTFDVYYAENPAVSTLNLTVQEPQPESMKKPAAVGYPQPTAPASESRVLLREVGREKPATVKRMLSDIYRQNRTDVKGIRTKKYGIGVEVLGIYVFNDVIYIHTCISNDTNISFEVDARRFIVADRKLAKRTAQQQTSLEILRVCNDPAVVRGHQRQRTVFALPKLTIPDDKVLLLEIVEKNGARHQTVEIPAGELLDAKLL